jgi:hypothetical protein
MKEDFNEKNKGLRKFTNSPTMQSVEVQFFG